MELKSSAVSNALQNHAQRTLRPLISIIMFNMTKRPFDSEIVKLRYPRDKARIAKLSLEWFQAWYLSQDSREIIYMAQFKEFQRFIFWNYTWKVKLLRLYYQVKRTLLGV